MLSLLCLQQMNRRYNSESSHKPSNIGASLHYESQEANLHSQMMYAVVASHMSQVLLHMQAGHIPLAKFPHGHCSFALLSSVLIENALSLRKRGNRNTFIIRTPLIRSADIHNNQSIPELGSNLLTWGGTRDNSTNTLLSIKNYLISGWSGLEEANIVKLCSLKCIRHAPWVVLTRQATSIKTCIGYFT